MADPLGGTRPRALAWPVGALPVWLPSSEGHALVRRGRDDVGGIDARLAMSEGVYQEVVVPFAREWDETAASLLGVEPADVMAGLFRRYHQDAAVWVTRVRGTGGSRSSTRRCRVLTAPGMRSNVTVLVLLEQYASVKIARAERDVRAIRTTRELGCEPGEPLLNIKRVYFDWAGSAVQVASALMHPERLVYAPRLTR